MYTYIRLWPADGIRSPDAAIALAYSNATRTFGSLPAPNPTLSCHLLTCLLPAHTQIRGGDLDVALRLLTWLDLSF